MLNKNALFVFSYLIYVKKYYVCILIDSPSLNVISKFLICSPEVCNELFSKVVD